jgi:hypothetical protein
LGKPGNHEQVKREDDNWVLFDDKDDPSAKVTKIEQ